LESKKLEVAQNSDVQPLSREELGSFFEAGQQILSQVDNLIRQVSCRRRSVAAILARNRRVIASAHNGPAANDKNDCGRCRISGTLQVMPACIFDHAEARSCLEALPGDTLLTSTSPCAECATIILRKQIGTVLYLEAYSDLSPVLKLISGGMSVFQITKSEDC
jgi:deoxycytidylate deaminase